MHSSGVVATTAHLQTIYDLTAHFKCTFKTVLNVHLINIHCKRAKPHVLPVYCSFKECLKIRTASEVEPDQSQVEAPPLNKQHHNSRFTIYSPQFWKGGEAASLLENPCRMTIASSTWQQFSWSAYYYQSTLCMTIHLTVSQVHCTTPACTHTSNKDPSSRPWKDSLTGRYQSASG